MEPKRAAPSARGLHPKLPKSRKGRHNNAKIAINKVIDERAEYKRAPRRAYLRRFRKSVQEMKVQRSSNTDDKFEGKFCSHGSPDGTRKSLFELESLPHKAPVSTEDIKQGLWMHGDDGTFLCVRVAKRKADELRSRHQQWRDTIRKALPLKDDVKRGAACNGSADRYIIFGHRKNPKGRDIGEYAFKAHATEEAKAEVNDEIKTMVEAIESIAAQFIHPDDLYHLGALRDACNLPSVSGLNVSTQFSVGRDYWSPMHVDDDYFWTILSTLDSENNYERTQVLHWFVFPDYGAAVPLLPGDILIFNPRLIHGCTNPSQPGSLIFSAYVSSKTVATQAANTLDK